MPLQISFVPTQGKIFLSSKYAHDETHNKFKSFFVYIYSLPIDVVVIIMHSKFKIIINETIFNVV
jgi:hypothetical protein